MSNYYSQLAITSETLIATWWQHTLIEEFVFEWNKETYTYVVIEVTFHEMTQYRRE
jgi:hypothetical protein